MTERDTNTPAPRRESRTVGIENTMEDTTPTPTTEPESGPVPMSHPSDLMAEGVTHIQVGEWAEALMLSAPGALYTHLRFWRDAYRSRQAELDRASTTTARHANRAHALSVMLDRDREALKDALAKVHGDTEPHGLEWEGWSRWLKIAFASGVLYGHATEAHTLAEHLADEFGSTAREVWREVSADLRTTEGTWPDPVSIEEAVTNAYRRYGHHDILNPADPRLEDGWRVIWRTAKSAGLCEIFDTLAVALGVPAQTFTRSGTVTVRFSGEVSIDVENVGEDIWEHLDRSDVLQALSAWDLDIEEMDDSDLTADA